jgi:hypothetical protein
VVVLAIHSLFRKKQEGETLLQKYEPGWRMGISQSGFLETANAPFMFDF